jgi:hypothetical protein
MLDIGKSPPYYQNYIRILTMGYESYWNFYQVSDKMFPAINFEFASAQNGMRTIFNEKSYIEAPGKSSERNILDHRIFFHDPFAHLDYRVSRNNNLHLPFIAGSSLSRVLPTVVLFYGIGQNRFFQLPGCFGNMIIHSSDIDRAISKISKILDVDREIYFQKASPHLDYSDSSDEHQEEREDVFEALDKLPNALANAKSSGVGLISLVTREFWSPRTLIDHP